VTVARTYLDAGAAAISVLTERHYFKGSPDNLRKVRTAFPDALILKKDFIVDEYQLLEARHEGADAVLLIAALLGAERLGRFHARAVDLGLTPLVEVHDESELAEAVATGAELIGINNRDLRTLGISLDVSRRLARLAPRGSLLITESGITRADELVEMRGLGFRGALVGSALMREADPGRALASLIGASS
jgi:indole-3-glycerol phosphate synthase